MVESVVGERSAGKKTRTRGETVESILVTLARSEPRVGDSPRLSPRGWAFGRARSCTEHLRVLLRVHRHGTFFRLSLFRLVLLEFFLELIDDVEQERELLLSQVKLRGGGV